MWPGNPGDKSPDWKPPSSSSYSVPRLHLMFTLSGSSCHTHLLLACTAISYWVTFNIFKDRTARLHAWAPGCVPSSCFLCLLPPHYHDTLVSLSTSPPLRLPHTSLPGTLCVFTRMKFRHHFHRECRPIPWAR